MWENNSNNFQNKINLNTMTTYLDLLPNDVLNIIENKVLEMFLDEHKKKMKDLHIELSSFWLIALWGAGFGKNNVVKNLYSSSKEHQHMLVKEYDYFIKYLRTSDILSFPKPKTIHYIMTHFTLHDTNPHKDD